MGHLKDGHLSGIISSVKKDDTLDFQIRENEIHIYYRGGRILGLKADSGGYIASFDDGYCKGSRYKDRLAHLPKHIASEEESSKWVLAFPELKQTVDNYLATEKEKNEREFQQLVVRENNTTNISNNTDYFILDIEYTSKGQTAKGRYDMVALAWPTSKRKSSKADLAFIEMKFGENALGGNSGILEHIRDMNDFLGADKNLSQIQKEMAIVFKQKRELGLIKSIRHNSNEIEKFSNNMPDFILLIAGHSPNSRILFEQLKLVQRKGATLMENVNLKIATANFMGYALYSKSLYGLDEFIEKFSDQICCK